MSFGDVLRTLFEIALVGFALWAVLHEDMFIAMEERFFSSIRRRRLKIARCENFRTVNTRS